MSLHDASFILLVVDVNLPQTSVLKKKNNTNLSQGSGPSFSNTLSSQKCIVVLVWLPNMLSDPKMLKIFLAMFYGQWGIGSIYLFLLFIYYLFSSTIPNGCESNASSSAAFLAGLWPPVFSVVYSVEI